MAMIESFFKAIAKIIKNKSNYTPDELNDKLEDVYKDYLKNDREYFLNNDLKSIITSFSGNDDIEKSKLLAELLYRELELFDTSERSKMIAGKLIDLYDYIDINSKEFSFERQSRKEEIKRYL